MTKEKEVVQVDVDVSPTLADKLEINVLAKIFPYLQFMDHELMTLACLEELWGGVRTA